MSDRWRAGYDHWKTTPPDDPEHRPRRMCGCPECDNYFADVDREAAEAGTAYGEGDDPGLTAEEGR
jgi:hypothetical protein